MVFTLLVFKAYLHMHIIDLFISIIIQKTATIEKTMNKIINFRVED